MGAEVNMYLLPDSKLCEHVSLSNARYAGDVVSRLACTVNSR